MINEATNQQERTLKYKVPYESTFVGKGTIFTREKQVNNIEYFFSVETKSSST